MAVLLISPEPWDAHAVSKHHYARTLAQHGHRVLFLGPPERSCNGIHLEPVDDQPGLERVHAPRVAPGLRRMPSLIRRTLERRWLHRLEQLAGCRIDVVWLFENSRFYDLRFAGSRLKIYQQVDLNQDFYPAIAARNADICFCTTELIRKKLLPHNPRCYRLQHGLANTSDPIPLNTIEQQRFIPGKIQAMYVGNLEMAYLDWDLLARVIARHPDVCFHLVGGYRREGALFQQLGSTTNVVWWGQIESAKIHSLLAKADILMVCYQADHHADQANPHKLMEYLSSGRTVVATYTDEYAVHADLMTMSDPGNNDAYPELFASVLARLREFNAPERIHARREFAAANSYPAQLARIHRHLAHHDLSFPCT